MAGIGDGYEVVIVGGGPAGLAAATVLGRSHRKVALIDAAQQSNRGSEAVHAVFGHDGLPPEDLYDLAREHLKRYRSVELIDGVASSTTVDSEALRVELESGRNLQASYLVLAQGVKYSHPPIPGIAEHWGKQVWHCPYCHGFEVSGKRLLAIGDEIWVKGMRDLLPIWTDKIVWADPAHVTGIRSQGSELFACFDGGEQAFNQCVVQTTVTPRDGIADAVGCARNEKGQVIIDSTGLTSVPRVYCAGDQSTEGGQVNIAAAAGHKVGVAINEALGIPGAQPGDSVTT